MIHPLRVWLFICICCCLPGCFAEHSFPAVPSHLAHLSTEQIQSGGRRVSTREWLPRLNAVANHLLPKDSQHGLTTDDLTLSGKPIDVYARFRMDPAHVDNFFGNLTGLEQSAQVASPPPTPTNGHIARAPLLGFIDVQVPVGGGVELYGRFGTPDPSNEIPGSYIIVTHGLFGTLDGHDMANHFEALRLAGHHVLALEMRGHGETKCLHPEYAISFGIRETGDLLSAANWLKSAHHATRVGLVCFSLTGYEGLLSAWLDGRVPVTEFANIPLLADLPRPLPEPAFNAGMLVISAPINILEVADRFDTRYGFFDAPCKSWFEGQVADRLASYHEKRQYSMWAMAQSEFARAGWAARYGSFDELKPELSRFLDLSAHEWQTGAARMNNIRTPVLVLSSVNDPLGTAQGVVDLFSRQHNPNIGVLILKGGGHMGFTSLSSDYYYSLMLNFFDPATAPAPV